MITIIMQLYFIILWICVRAVAVSLAIFANGAFVCVCKIAKLTRHASVVRIAF